AEDGIRDKLVTGVQTCALPILFNAPLLRTPIAAYRLWQRSHNSSAHVPKLRKASVVAGASPAPPLANRSACRPNHPAPLQAATSAIVLRTAVLRSRRMFRRKRAGLRTLK